MGIYKIEQFLHEICFSPVLLFLHEKYCSSVLRIFRFDVASPHERVYPLIRACMFLKTSKIHNFERAEA